jgi:OOP family OmpA-OmpF porin
MDTGRDVLGLAPTQRAKLNQVAESGIVAVHFTERGCNVELELLDCFAEGKYRYQPYSNEDHKTAYRAGDLWAQIPLGAARLGAGLQEGEALKKDVLMVGTVYLPPDATPGALRGRDCPKANYLIKSITVGGFTIHRGARQAFDGGVTFFGFGATGQMSQGVQRQDGDGSLPACLAASASGQPSPQCSAPLKIDLMPIEGTPAPTVASRPGAPPPPPPPAPPPLALPMPEGFPFAMERGALKLPGPVAFEPDTDRLLAESDLALGHVKDYLDTKPNITLLRVEGHTDNSGSPTTNQRLSERRDLAVSRWLVAHGVDCHRLLPVGFGQRHPTAGTLVAQTPDEKRENRRISFVNASISGSPIGGLVVDAGGTVAGDPCH